MIGNLVYDLLIVLAAGLVAGLGCRRLRVSVLVGYLLVGAVVGKGCFGWVADERHQIEYLAEAGVFLLLFSIGLEFSLEELMRLGRNLVIGGSLQMLLVALPIVAVLLAVGMDWRPAVLIAAAASFSSTVLVFKVLSEWGHSRLSHGRRAIGILLLRRLHRLRPAGRRGPRCTSCIQRHHVVIRVSADCDYFHDRQPASDAGDVAAKCNSSFSGALLLPTSWGTIEKYQ